MNHREFIEWLRGVEAEFPVDRWTVSGVAVWPTIRLSLYAATFGVRTKGHSVDAGSRRHLEVVVEGLVAWARAYIGDFGRNRRPTESADAVFLTPSIGRQPLVDGKRYSIYAAPYVELLQRLGKRSLVWEMSPFSDYNIPRYTPSFFVQPRLIAYRVASEILPLGRDRVELERYHEFVDRATAAGLQFPHSKIGRLRRDIAFLRRLAHRFGSWLRRARPRLGFVADTGLREQAFCLACRELGITSVEIQHGVQGELHPHYGSWSAIPPGGYPTRARVFWSWDEESAAAVAAWSVRAPGRHEAIIGGDPSREVWAEGDTEQVRRVHAGVEARKKATGGNRHILVTLSSNGEVLAPCLADAIRMSPSGWRYWLRLHPVNQAAQRAQALRTLSSLGVDFDLMTYASELPLHALLRHMDCHATAGVSTVIRDAAVSGVPSVACRDVAREFYASEAERGMLVIASTGSEVVAAVERLAALPCPKPGRGPSLAEAAMRRLIVLAS